MAFGKPKFGQRPKRDRQPSLFKRKKFCRFTAAGVKERSTSKDIDTLKDFIRGKQQDHAGRVTGTKARYQRQLTTRNQAAPASWRCCVLRSARSNRRKEPSSCKSSFLKKVLNVGLLGDIVKVKDGYARNFLIPQGKAKTRDRRRTLLTSLPVVPTSKRLPPKARR